MRWISWAFLTDSGRGATRITRWMRSRSPISRKNVNWVLDADVREFFTNLDHRWLAKFLEHRIADERVLRLIGKWLSAGVIEDGEWSETEQGAPQGASATPPTHWATSALM
jgi:retron-type reverse transcriptase